MNKKDYKTYICEMVNDLEDIEVLKKIFNYIIKFFIR